MCVVRCHSGFFRPPTSGPGGRRFKSSLPDQFFISQSALTRFWPCPKRASDIGRVAHSFAHIANEWGLRGGRLPEALEWLGLDHQGAFLKIHPDRSALGIGIGTEAAPATQIRFRYQSAPHWVPVHVAQLFNELALAPHVEVIEPLLPDVPWASTGWIRLCRGRTKPGAAHHDRVEKLR
jgi:hypothetical protein